MDVFRSQTSTLSSQVAVSEAGELKEELKTLKTEYQACQSRYDEERARLENDVTTLGEKLATLERTRAAEKEEKVKLEKELRKVRRAPAVDAPTAVVASFVDAFRSAAQ